MQQILARSPAASSSAVVPAGRRGHRAFRSVSCAAKPQQQEVAEELPRRVAAGFLAMASAATMVLMPLEAQAVSGGGGISAPISGEDFSNRDLRKFKFTKAIMRQTNFSGSDLTGVSLFGSLAIGANFSGANLTNADLESADFEGADFTNAILTGAYVNNAQFKDVKITGTDWSDVILRKDIQKDLCKVADGTNPVTGVDTRESLFCP